MNAKLNMDAVAEKIGEHLDNAELALDSKRPLTHALRGLTHAAKGNALAVLLLDNSAAEDARRIEQLTEMVKRSRQLINDYYATFQAAFLVQSGRTVDEGLSVQVIEQPTQKRLIRHVNGSSPKAGTKKPAITPQELKTIEAMLLADKPVSEIMVATGRSDSAIWRIKQSMGQTRTRRGTQGLKLNEVKVKDIRRRIARGESDIEIAHVHGCSPANISLIRTGKIWKHVP
jgi:hypothetical protein